MDILAIVGSPRLNGNTGYLVDQALEEASRLGARTGKIVLSRYHINPCLGHEDCSAFDSCRQQDDAGSILERLCAADGVILATPVYYYSVSAQMKTLIDRTYFLYRHGRRSPARAVGFIVVAEAWGIEDTLRTLKQYVDWTFNVSDDKIFSVYGYTGNRPGEVKHNLSLVAKARELGRQMVATLK